MVLTALAGDASARFLDAKAAVGTQAAVLAEAGESRSRALWGSVTAGVAEGYASVAESYDQGKTTIEDYRASCEALVHEKVQEAESLLSHAIDRLRGNPTEEGEKDGQ